MDEAQISLDELTGFLAGCKDHHDDVGGSAPVVMLPEFGTHAPLPVTGAAIRYIAGSDEPPTVAIEYRPAPGAPVTDAEVHNLARAIVTAWDAAHLAADQGVVTAQLDVGQMGVLAGLIGAEQVATYARACLAAARPEREWFRQAFAQLEAAGERIVQTEQPGQDGGTWLVLDWRTGQTLASIGGGQDAYEAAWQDGWTDVSWIGRWLEDLATDGTPALNWPEALPPPPDVAKLTAAPPPLALPGLPASLRVRLEEAIDEWAVCVGATEGRAAEVAQLTGWTKKQVLACTGSYLAMTGEQYMHLGAAGEGES